MVSHHRLTLALILSNIRSTQAGMAAPEQERQEDHEKSVSAEVGRECKVRVKRRGADYPLHPGKVWRLISDQW